MIGRVVGGEGSIDTGRDTDTFPRFHSPILEPNLYLQQKKCDW